MFGEGPALQTRIQNFQGGGGGEDYVRAVRLRVRSGKSLMAEV